MSRKFVEVEIALEQLKSTVTKEECRSFSDARIEHVWKTAREIEREEGLRLNLQFMGRIEPLLKTLESYSGVMEVLCQGHSAMAFVWVRFDLNPNTSVNNENAV